MVLDGQQDGAERLLGDRGAVRNADVVAEAWAEIAEVTPGSRVLIVADHASARVPADIALGVEPGVLGTHIAIDIGVAPLAVALCAAIGCGAILGNVSRLVCDFNRDEDVEAAVPLASDGVPIPGNCLPAPGRKARIARFHAPYHAAVARAVAADAPTLFVSLHSFTPRLATKPEEARPWQVGVLYNRDDRAARIALSLLVADGVVAGDNQPYSGRVLNATMNRHAEANGIAYLGLEVRRDLIGDDSGVAAWAARLAPLIVSTRDMLAQAGA